MRLISDRAQISQLADIEDSVRGSRIVIADGVVIDAFVKVKAAGGDGNLVIGRNTHINSGCVLYLGNGLQIGEDVLVAANCTFAPVNHEFRLRGRKILEQRFQPSRGGVVVEDDVWIGAGSVILDGAVLRRGCVIGALSLVNGEVEPYSVNAGNPLRRIGYRE